MTALAELQRLFAACLEGTADSGQISRFQGLLTTGGELTAQQRVAVYRGSSREARLSSLDVVFPVCRSILAERCFRGLATAYLDATPSLSGDLNLYGDTFPDFLRGPIESANELAAFPYLADLARLEWNWHAVYYAPNDPPFDMEGFDRASGGGGAEGIRFRLAAGLRLLWSDYPVGEIWRRHREGADTSCVPMGNGDRLVIRRDVYVPLIEAVEPGLSALLAAIAEGRSLGELAAGGLDLERLPGLIAAGWISGFSAPPG